MHNLISTLHENNNKLTNKADSMHSDLLHMQRSLREKDDAIKSLTMEIKDLRATVSAAFVKVRSQKEANYENGALIDVSTTNNSAIMSRMEAKTKAKSSVVANNALAVSTVVSGASDKNVYTHAGSVLPTNVTHTSTYTEMPAVSVAAGTAVKNVYTHAGSALPMNAAHTHTYADMLKTTADISTANVTHSLAPAVSSAEIKNAQWSTVKNKRGKKPVRVVGTNISKDLDVAVRYKWLHLASFSPSVSEENIINYVSNQAGLNKDILVCYKLVKKDVEISSLKRVNFKLGVPETMFSNLLSSEIWPTNVTVKPFRFFPKDQQQPLQT
ncbi:PREDICTED: uncharacterized protein LOC108359223 isoform X2 [Rhagoletis zephyria]|uniref:uncharacterized protein LOC108359223 isoform X2 n=1 Tax=Rhagoletis zephyria TaxID=28612 RepID=UPI000811939C|nr:PREDICTED: uncharacterized protein LOC108359223 isoform X2 [Rhagoletis zephyria]